MTASVLYVIKWRKDGCSASDGPYFRRHANCARISPVFLRHCLALVLFLGFMAASLAAQNGVRTVHVFVALADNKNQGIVPVAASLGNGEDPARNLYWGSACGIKRARLTAGSRMRPMTRSASALPPPTTNIKSAD